MKTIKEIEGKLKVTDELAPWMDELAGDSRAGVKAALAKWQRRYAKRELVKKEHASKVAFDRSYARFDGALIAGVDEAGRGPLAGPVVSAVVILPEDVPELIGLDDSKAISKINRENLAEKIRNVAIDYSIHIQPATKIDELNIYVATRDSMESAVKSLSVQPDFVIVDAMALTINCPTASVIKGDAKSLAVAAASILAKTTRDAIMEEIHNEYPTYNFAKNAGYGTSEHLEALTLLGPCKHHRNSFEPVKSMINRINK
ncbi:ribonuclease HII [Sporosarcina sp. G11-34]|nr:ribonuclease HII [Sporosarcina sp. G11-34]